MTEWCEDDQARLLGDLEKSTSSFDIVRTSDNRRVKVQGDRVYRQGLTVNFRQDGSVAYKEAGSNEFSEGIITCVHDETPAGILGHVDPRSIRIDYQRPLGQGGYGKVFQGYNTAQGGKICAVKQIVVSGMLDRHRCLSDSGKEAILREWQVSKYHAINQNLNVLRPWGYYIENEKV